MRLLHTSDLHIGKRVNGFSMIEDQRYILEKLLGICTERDVDMLLIAGDIYDKASPSAEAVTVFDGFLTKLSAAGVQVAAIPGNHDSAERISFAQSLLFAQGVFFPPVYDGALRRLELDDEYGQLYVWLLPFLKPSDVRRFFPERRIEDDYAAALQAVIEAADIDETARNIVLSHQLVTALGVGPDRADDEIKLGGIDNVDVSVYSPFDYVALGHVHRAQRVGRDEVRYSGSPLKYSFSEVAYNKSVVLVDIGRKEQGAQTGACVNVELIGLEPLHDMRELEIGAAELGALAQCEDASAHDYLRVVLTDKYEQLDALHKVRKAFPNVMLVEQWSPVLADETFSEAPEVDPDETSMVDLFADFFEQQTSTPLDEEQLALVTALAHDAELATASGDAADAAVAR